MKKVELRAEMERLALEAHDTYAKLGKLEQANAQLKAEVETMREHWRPVPVQHPWQPRNPQCAMCDEPKDSPRHV